MFSGPEAEAGGAQPAVAEMKASPAAHEAQPEMMPPKEYVLAGQAVQLVAPSAAAAKVPAGHGVQAEAAAEATK